MPVKYQQHLVQSPGVAPYYNITNEDGFVIMTVNAGTRAYEAFRAGVEASPDIELDLTPRDANLLMNQNSVVVIINPSDSVCATGGVMLDPWHQVNVVDGKISGAQYPMTDEDRVWHIKRMKAKPTHYI